MLETDSEAFHEESWEISKTDIITKEYCWVPFDFFVYLISLAYYPIGWIVKK